MNRDPAHDSDVKAPGDTASHASPATDAERFALRRHRVVSAGAGTGKTHALLTQYLHLVAGFTALGQPLLPRSIAALTFTEKAAAELRERLGRRLLSIIRGAENLHSNSLASEPDLCSSATAMAMDWPAVAHFEVARTQLAMAPIGTFHSFAAAMLRRHAIAAGIEPDFGLLDEETARDLLGESCERAVLAALDGDGNDPLAQNTAELVTEYGFAGDHGLVAALCRLLLARAEEGSSAAGLSAAYEPSLLDDERARIFDQAMTALSTLSSLAGQLASKSAERIAFAQSLRPALSAALSSLSTIEQAAEIFASLLTELRYVSARGDDVREPVATAREQLKTAAQDSEALALSVRAAPLSEAIAALLTRAQALYEEAKRASTALDFSDLLRRCRDLLRDQAAVRTREQARFAVLLVDEFQDTSPLQAEILSLLIVAPDAKDSDGASRPLYIVGDRKQSIYGFRGADVAAYEQVCQRLIAAGADEETLRTSRRSRPALIEFTNALFARIFTPSSAPSDSATAGQTATVGQVRWEDRRDDLVSAREESPAGRPLVEVLSTEEVASAANEAATTPTEPGSEAGNSEPPTDDAMGREASLVSRRIAELLESGTRARDIVLLLRRFTHLLRYTGALTQAAIPHYVVRGRGYFAAQEVLDLVAFLSLLDDPHDRLALLAVLRSPICALSDDTLAQLHLAGLLSLPTLLSLPATVLAEHVPLPADEQSRLAGLLSLLTDLQPAAARIGPVACLQSLFDCTDYLALLCGGSSRSGPSLGEQRIANVERLSERAAAHEARGGSLASFARGLRQDSDPRVKSGYGDGDDPLAPIVGEADDVVRVMTIHQSKGLEFPIVIVAGCASTERSESPAISYDRAVGLGLRLWLPGALGGMGPAAGRRAPTLAARRVQAVTRQRSLAESARLFYVAATRASERLIVVGESRRGPSPSGTWKAQVESLRAERPDLLEARRVSAVTPSAVPTVEPAGLLDDSPVLAKEAERLRRLVYAPLCPSPTAAGLPLSLSAAADLAVCPRRYHLRHRFRLHESEPALAPGHSDEAPGELALGPLSVTLLNEVDLRQADDELSSRLATIGCDLRDPALGELVTRLHRFLQSPTVRRLLSADAPPLRRALPFDVPLAGLRLRDHFDWVIGDGTSATAGGLHVLHFRYGYSPDESSSLAQAQTALLAVATKESFPAHRDTHIGFCDLREALPRPRWLAVETVLAEAATRTHLTQLVEHSEPALLGTACALSLPRLPRTQCDAIHCGYRYHCFRR